MVSFNPLDLEDEVVGSPNVLVVLPQRTVYEQMKCKPSGGQVVHTQRTSQFARIAVRSATRY